MTSANFSSAAWGRWTPQGLQIQNFELGVLLDRARYPFQTQPLNEDNVFVRESESFESPLGIVWAQAEWDGSHVLLAFRTRPDEVRLEGFSIRWVDNGHTGEEAVQPAALEPGTPSRARILWEDSRRVPVEAELQAPGASPCYVPVTDVRPVPVRVSDPLPQPGLDRETERELRDALLLQKYAGGTSTGPAEELDQPDLLDPDFLLSSLRTAAADYSVSAFVQAREWFGIMDEWDRQIGSLAEQDEVRRTILKRDGQALVRYFERQRQEANDAGHRVAADLAAEELNARLTALSGTGDPTA
jgi:hypothetical protein